MLGKVKIPWLQDENVREGEAVGGGIWHPCKFLSCLPPCLGQGWEAWPTHVGPSEGSSDAALGGGWDAQRRVGCWSIQMLQECLAPLAWRWSMAACASHIYLGSACVGPRGHQPCVRLGICSDCEGWALPLGAHGLQRLRDKVFRP